MLTLLAVHPLPGGKKFVLVFSDNSRLVVTAERFVLAKLHKGAALSVSAIQTLKQQSLGDALYAYALYRLALRPHGQIELSQKLRLQHYKLQRKLQLPNDPTVLTQVLAKLHKHIPPDDEAFVEWFIRKEANKHRAKTVIRQKLLSLGFTDQHITRKLNELVLQTDEAQAVANLLTRYNWKVNQHDPKKRSQIIQRILRRGFSYACIKSQTTYIDEVD